MYSTDLQHTGKPGMYNLKFTITMYINNASNYQSTDETYYTQENTMITKHKRP